MNNVIAVWAAAAGTAGAVLEFAEIVARIAARCCLRSRAAAASVGRAAGSSGEGIPATEQEALVR